MGYLKQIIGQLLAACASLSLVMAVPVCRDPENKKELYNELKGLDSMHESRWQTPEHRPDLDVPSASNTEEKITPRGTNTTCPLAAKSGLYEEVEARSTCPWYFVTNRDRNRYPELLSEVKCKCDHCLHAGGTANRCERVYYNVRVLRRTHCVDGVYKYEMSWQRLAVACTCAVPSSGNSVEEEAATRRPPPMPVF